MKGTARGHAGGQKLEWLGSAHSTNDEVRERWAGGAAGFPHLSSIATLWQTGGRGRQGREWVSPRGECLAISTLLRFPADGPARGRLGWLPLVAGLAMREALAEALGEAGASRLAIKWPNDVLLDERKLSGILGEVLGESGGELACVVGAGVNVLVPAERLPVPEAISLRAAGVPGPDPAVLAPPYLAALARRVEALDAHGWDADAAGVRAELLGACVTIGQRVRVALPGGRSLAGEAIGLGPGGELLVRDARGAEHAVSAGDVERVRPA